MEMTFAILQYLLQRKGGPGTVRGPESQGAERIIRRLRCPRAGQLPPLSPEPDTLFLAPAETGDGVELWVPEGADGTGCHCRVCGEPDPEQVLEQAAECWQEADAWENRLASMILRHAPFEQILDQGRQYLGREYALIDSELRVSFSTPGYLLAGMAEEQEEGGFGQRLSSELSQSLLLRKDFHEAAQKKEGFYFLPDYTEAKLYCRNIFVHGQYYARLLCRLHPGESVLSRGEEQLVEVFGRYVELLFQNSLQSLKRHQNDAMHQLCRALYAGEKPDPAMLDMALHAYHWKQSHSFRTVLVTAYGQEGWQTQMEITLPFLIRELEVQWEESCAISVGERILWLVNLSRTEQESFFSRFSLFIRENVCRAGVSAAFSHISLLRTAAVEAEAALRLGSRIHQTRWYYLFEDYRLAYCLEAMQRELPASRLLHPSVRILRDRDREKGTEYVATLRAYLESQMNMTRAAEKLYVHRTTFCRRMDQIHRLTGVYEASGEQLLAIGLSLKLLDEMESKNT